MELTTVEKRFSGLMIVSIVLALLLVAGLSVVSFRASDMVEKRELHLQVVALGQENQRLHIEVSEYKRENIMLAEYVRLVAQNGGNVLRPPEPTSGVPLPEATPIDVRILVPTLPAIVPTFVTATPTATPFAG